MKKTNEIRKKVPNSITSSIQASVGVMLKEIGFY